jgi:hypothetical protein
VWVDLPGEGDGASRRFRQRGANPREEPGALAALAGIWAGKIAGLDVLLRDEHSVLNWRRAARNPATATFSNS